MLQQLLLECVLYVALVAGLDVCVCVLPQGNTVRYWDCFFIREQQQQRYLV
jgi:hypothetical protein